MKKYFIGLMSGTSLDAIDIVIIYFQKDNRFKIVAKDSFSIPRQIKIKLKKMIENPCNVSLQELGESDMLLGNLYANSINLLLSKKNISHKKIYAIGNHGQTIFH